MFFGNNLLINVLAITGQCFSPISISTCMPFQKKKKQVSLETIKKNLPSFLLSCKNGSAGQSGCGSLTRIGGNPKGRCLESTVGRIALAISEFGNTA